MKRAWLAVLLMGGIGCSQKFGQAWAGLLLFLIVGFFICRILYLEEQIKKLEKRLTSSASSSSNSGYPDRAPDS